MKTLPYYIFNLCVLCGILQRTDSDASSAQSQKQNTTKNHMAQEKFPAGVKILKIYHSWEKVEASGCERPWSNTTKTVRKSARMLKITKQKSARFAAMLGFVDCFQGE